MKFSVETELLGEVRGSVFTTDSLAFASNPIYGATIATDQRSVTIVWNDEKGWRLKRLLRGNEPASLPGKEHVLTANEFRNGRSKIFIVVANRNSGLYSCHNWLRYGKHDLRTLSVNLVDAQEASNDPDERLKALAQSL